MSVTPPFTVSRRARADLHGIWAYVAEGDEARADRLLEEFDTAFELLAANPGFEHERDEVDNPRLRFWSVGRYTIAYEKGTKPLNIVRVVGGRQDFRDLFRRN